MRIRITPKQVTDNGYNKISPYYRQRVLFPETSKYAGYCIETTVYNSGSNMFIEPNESVKLIKVADREIGKRYNRPILSLDELANELGVFNDALWLARFNNYMFNGKTKVSSWQALDIGYYDGNAWFTTLDGVRHRTSANSFELLKSVDQAFCVSFNNIRAEINQIKRDLVELENLAGMLLRHEDIYQKKRLTNLVSAVIDQRTVLSDKREKMLAMLKTKEAVLDKMVNDKSANLQ